MFMDIHGLICNAGGEVQSAAKRSTTAACHASNPSEVSVDTGGCFLDT